MSTFLGVVGGVVAIAAVVVLLGFLAVLYFIGSDPNFFR